MSAILLVILAIYVGAKHEQAKKDISKAIETIRQSVSYHQATRMVERIFTLVDKYLDGRKAKVRQKPTHDILCDCAKCRPLSAATWARRLKKA